MISQKEKAIKGIKTLSMLEGNKKTLLQKGAQKVANQLEAGANPVELMDDLIRFKAIIDGAKKALDVYLMDAIQQQENLDPKRGTWDIQTDVAKYCVYKKVDLDFTVSEQYNQLHKQLAELKEAMKGARAAGKSKVKHNGNFVPAAEVKKEDILVRVTAQ